MPLFFNMANLSAYIDFSVQLNFSSKQITIEANNLGALPVDVTALTMSAKVKQPDCINGSMTVDVISLDPLEFDGTKTLRMTTAGNPQKGVYRVVLTVVAEGYDDTVIEKEFTLEYVKPVISISKDFDLLTPSLKLNDDTIYAITGLTSDVVSRAWVVQIGGVAEVGFSTQQIVLESAGNAYDAEYTATLTTGLTFAHPDYAYLSIVDEVEGIYQTTANTIPAFAGFPTMLAYIRSESSSDSTGDCCGDECDSADFREAFGLYKDIAAHICEAVSDTLLSNIEAFLAIYYKYFGAYENTDAIIPAYDLSFCTTQYGENSYIRNTLVEQANANITIDGQVTAAGTPHAVGLVERFAVIQNGTLKYLTDAEFLAAIGGGAGGGGVWGAITGDIVDQTDLQTALGNKVTKNANITAATKTKITYDVKGLVTGGDDLDEDDIPALSIGKTTELQDALDDKADEGHTHVIADVTGLQADLDAKAIDSLVVHKAGNENITGVKSFTLSPLVPTPVNNTHAANKKYVDDQIALVGGGTGVDMGPVEVILAVDGIYAIPAGRRLTALVVTPVGTSTIKVGLTPTGDEVMMEETLTAGSDKDITYALTCRVSKTLYFQGITSSTEILIYTDTLTPVAP